MQNYVTIWYQWHYSFTFDFKNLTGLPNLFLHFKLQMSKVFKLMFLFHNLSKDISFLYINRKIARKIYIRLLTLRMKNYLGLEVLLFFSVFLQYCHFSNLKRKSYTKEQQWDTTIHLLGWPNPEYWQHQNHYK